MSGTWWKIKLTIDVQMKLYCYTFLILLLAPLSQGAISAYLQIEGVQGESQNSGYEQWIDITGISRGGRNPVSISGSQSSATKYTPDALEITLIFPAGYNKLADFIVAGQNKKISLNIVQSSGPPYTIQTYIFHDCLFSTLLMDAKANGHPTVTLNFHYSRMEWEVRSLSDSGSPIVLGSLDYNQVQNTLNYSIPAGGGGSDPADSDSDDMPDTWESLHGLNPNSNTDRNTDPDLDGFSNYLEYLCGTDPKSYTSHLKIIHLVKPNGAVSATLEWFSVTGKSYHVQRATAGLNNADWTTLITLPASSGTSTSYTLPSTPSANVFYRVVLDR